MTMRVPLLAALLAAAPVCAALAQAPPVQVSGAWVRATAPHQGEAAAYMTLTSREADRLISIASAQAGMAMLHTTSHDHGTGGSDADVMRMREADGLDLPAGQAVVLSPGGTHVMLGGLRAPLRTGQVVALTLGFAHAPPVVVQVDVLPIGARGPAAAASAGQGPAAAGVMP